MKIGKDDLVAALGLRYDHYSATTMFEVARARAQLDDKPAYDPAEVTAFRTALARIGDRLDKVNARLDVLAGGAPVVEPVSAKVEPAPVVEPTPAKTAPVEPRPEPKVEAKSDDAPTKSRKRAKAEAEPAPAPAPAPTLLGSTAAPSPTPTIISLTGVELEDGEQLLVCGDFVAWDVSQAQPMVRVDDAFLGTVAVIPGEPSAFKFLRKTAGGGVVWEAGENRTVVGGSRLDVTWGVR